MGLRAWKQESAGVAFIAGAERNATVQMPSVASAIAAGHKAAAMVVHGLLFETQDVARAGAAIEAR